ncbi:MAG: GntR family transcriptional regulator [Candidatus Omnitrophota bacterium]|nr:GntR family transcriptional regulator [Candidatus Omnitrophota bacterium]MDZ4242505.1 GntR family transcriptional regulator [Candidatus Omnitrophota bacterium]
MSASPRYYFQILATSGVPIYRQITDQVKTHAAAGRLTPGAFLPSVRQVAAELEINPMTVSKAYSLLEKEGVLEFVRGQGMRVKISLVPKKNVENREDQIVPLLREVMARAEQLSLSPQRVLELLKDLWKEKKNG